jgi:hypothetical protein
MAAIFRATPIPQMALAPQSVSILQTVPQTLAAVPTTVRISQRATAFPGS